MGQFLPCAEGRTKQLHAYKQFSNEITLPMHTLLSDEESVYVAETFKICMKGVKSSEGY